MKIVDKRIDFYDGLARTFRDDEPLYVRSPEEATIQLDRNSHFSLIGFCGQLYPYFLLAEEGHAPTIIFDRDSAIEIVISRIGIINPLRRRESKLGRLWFRGRWRYYSNDWNGLIAMPWDEQFKKAPIWVIRELRQPSSKIEYNPMLRDFGFFKVEPPEQAFQKLNMWLSNQARPTKPMPAISDELKAQSRGFDKESFRGFKRRS